MPRIDDTTLQEIITGRIVPHIYSFETNTLPNYLKIGDTYRPVDERLNEWRRYYKDLSEVSRHEATVENEVFFRDYAVHRYLETNGITRVPFDEQQCVFSNEFFKDATKDDVISAVNDIRDNYQKTAIYDYYDNFKERVEYHYERTLNFAPRQNQQQVIDNFKVAVENGRTNLLMYAVMRFGKSITSIWCAKANNAKLTVIVSAKADVRSEWKQTVESHVDFTGYRFIDSSELKTGISPDDLYGQTFKTGIGKNEICTNIVIFFTLQDLAGSTETIKNHHKILQKAKVDLLIIDETHFGARAQVLGKILAGLELTDEDRNALKDKIEDTEKLGELNKLTSIRATIKLHLSGTPYRILMGSEFDQQDIIAFVQFSDIYEAKLAWGAEHIDVDEWRNPYYGFPQMIRFAFNPNESSRKLLAQIPGSKPAELFAPVSISKNGRDYDKFRHEREVMDLLQVLDGSKNDSELLGILDNVTVKSGKLAQHIVFVLPFRASCDALEKLIATNKGIFKNIAQYQILNISGYDKTLSTPEEIKTAIKQAHVKNKKTITLTVNKMLTGTTVPQWDTMVYLKSTASPQEYDQAIFRLQSPWVETYKDAVGDIIKYDMKPQTLLVDLDPTRLFYLQEMKAFTYGANIQKIGNENIESCIERELRVSPIIALNAAKNKLVEVSAAKIMDEVRKYASERTITEDVSEIGIDLTLKENQEIYSLISRLSELGGKNGLNIKPVEGDGEDLEGTPTEDSGETDDPNTTDDKPSSDKDEIKDTTFEKQFRTYYVMILLFAFLSETEEKSLTDVINNIDASDDNRRIAKNLGLKKEDLVLIRNNINWSVLTSLDYKIQNSDFRANDQTITPQQHIDIAIHKFGRLSDAEVFTPSGIVGKMYDAFDKGFWQNAANQTVLDIASKSGSFAKGFVAKALQNGANLADIQNNFYSIPTSSTAYEFTRKTYEALGLCIDNIAQHFTSFDLIKLSDEKLHNLLITDKKFCDITKDDLKKHAKIKSRKSEGNVKFTAVVGNPPYDRRTETNFSTSIYHEFFDAALSLNTRFVTMIHPAKFLFNSGATPKSWNKKMLNDPHLTIAMYEPDIKKIFQSVGAKGGVCITFWDRNQTDGGLGGVFIAQEALRSIMSKVKIGGLDEIVSSAGGSPTKRYNDKYGRKRSYFRTSAFFDLADVFTLEPDPMHTIKIIGLEKGNKRSERYVSRDVLNDKNLEKWKVLLPKSNGSGTIGEILSTPLVGEPLVGSTESFIQIGQFDDEIMARNCLKYIKTKFCRTMLGTLKITQDNPKSVWKNVPIQNFTNDSDIDWSKSITDIDKRLYAKYGLSEQEIEFIETHVKAME
jgi:superfamily II DNA or RNA helicase